MKTFYMVVSGVDEPDAIREVKIPDLLFELMVKRAIEIATRLSIDEPKATYHIIWID